MGKEKEPWQSSCVALYGDSPSTPLFRPVNPPSLPRNVPGGGESPPRINGRLVLAQGARHQPGRMGENTSELLLLLRIILPLAVLTERCQGHGQILKGPRLRSSAAFCLFVRFTLPACSSPQEEDAAGSAPCAQPRQGWVTLVPSRTSPPCPTPN